MLRTVILFFLSVLSFVIGFFQLREKGPLLNNAAIFAAPKERKTMNKTPHYRQSGVVFSLLGVFLLLLALEGLWATGWLSCLAWAAASGTVAYAVASSVRSELRTSRR